MMSCMAENGLKDDVIGLILDGTGLGTDGTIWGGEFLTMQDRKITRFFHFSKGDAARAGCRSEEPRQNACFISSSF